MVHLVPLFFLSRYKMPALFAARHQFPATKTRNSFIFVKFVFFSFFECYIKIISLSSNKETRKICEIRFIVT